MAIPKDVYEVTDASGVAHYAENLGDAKSVPGWKRIEERMAVRGEAVGEWLLLSTRPAGYAVLVNQAQLDTWRAARIAARAKLTNAEAAALGVE
jgi:hypothetical protein